MNAVGRDHPEVIATWLTRTCEWSTVQAGVQARELRRHQAGDLPQLLRVDARAVGDVPA